MIYWKDLYYPYETVYDFEARIQQLEVIDNDNKLKIISQHIPVSVPINSNIPDYDKAYFICNEKSESLIDDFVKYILNYH